MSDFFIQEKPFGKSTQTIVKDANGHPLYTLIGNWGNRGDCLTLYQMDGQVAASVKQVSLPFVRRFEIFEAGKKVGVLQRFFNWPSDFYYVQQLHWTVYGNLQQHQYKIHHFNKEIMTMNKTKRWHGDHYLLHVHKDEDAPVCLCIASILDYWLYMRERPPLTYYKEALDLA
ncbi:LURP-one-related/scramblase family protein [Enterococcus sp. LJL98]